ncbi:MAG: ubiquinol-cytochrome c reductase iron-sulfur subunit [Gammaproteobacteria bacterium]|nr:ubiquinol-cytochrome c reductase iron-sulfur subunit [Gammaproteobacteria bacterium]
MSEHGVDADFEVDESRRRFLTGSMVVVGGVGVAMGAVPFMSSFQPSARARAVGAPVEVDISKVEPGQRIIETWRGKPVWVVRRTPEMLAALNETADLTDPDSEASKQPEYAANQVRSIKPEYLVLVGVCTHLGCSPTFVPKTAGAEAGLGNEWRGGFFCPCHGSRFDLAGRVAKGSPAPLNLEVPPYKYLSDTMILIGEDQGAAA